MATQSWVIRGGEARVAFARGTPRTFGATPALPGLALQDVGATPASPGPRQMLDGFRKRKRATQASPLRYGQSYIACHDGDRARRPSPLRRRQLLHLLADRGLGRLVGLA